MLMSFSESSTRWEWRKVASTLDVFLKFAVRSLTTNRDRPELQQTFSKSSTLHGFSSSDPESTQIPSHIIPNSPSDPSRTHSTQLNIQFNQLQGGLPGPSGMILEILFSNFKDSSRAEKPKKGCSKSRKNIHQLYFSPS